MATKAIRFTQCDGYKRRMFSSPYPIEALEVDSDISAVRDTATHMTDAPSNMPNISPKVLPSKSLSSQLAVALIAPPPEEIEILYELAMLGNMKKIRQQAQYLKSLDSKYTLLADKLDELAQGFQEKAILELIEQYFW